MSFVSRLDVSLNNEYNSKGASLVRAIIEAIDKIIKGECICVIRPAGLKPKDWNRVYLRI